MPSLLITEWWLVINSAVLLVLAVSLGLLWLKHKNTVASLNAALELLKHTQSAITNSTVGMGQRLNQLSGKVHKTEAQMLMSNQDEVMLAQATRLVQLGASASDLVESCGVPRGEAELLVSMQKKLAQTS